MPGRKSNVSTAGPEEVVDTTPSAPNKQSKDKDGLSVDVSTDVVTLGYLY